MWYVAEELTERQLIIIEMIGKGVAQNVAVNTKYLSEKLNVNRKTIQRDMAYLQEKRQIVKRFFSFFFFMCNCLILN